MLTIESTRCTFKALGLFLEELSRTTDDSTLPNLKSKAAAGFQSASDYDFSGLAIIHRYLISMVAFQIHQSEDISPLRNDRPISAMSALPRCRNAGHRHLTDSMLVSCRRCFNLPNTARGCLGRTPCLSVMSLCFGPKRDELDESRSKEGSHVRDLKVDNVGKGARQKRGVRQWTWRRVSIFSNFEAFMGLLHEP